MDVFFFRPDIYERLYNCSLYEVTDVPLEKRQHFMLGCLFLLTFVIYETLYIPCLLAIRKHLTQTSYVFMFYIGLVDVACLWINGFFTGLFAIQGYVFCSSPTLIYVTGSLGLTFWIGESTGAILLASNRCMEMWSPTYARIVFGREYALYWLIPPSLLSLYYAFFTKPIAFTGIHVSWFFNPHVGYIQGVDGEAFFQVVRISGVNATAAAVAVYAQYSQASEFLIIVAQMAWHSAHGLPAIIYLTMNETLRKDVVEIFCGKRANPRVLCANPCMLSAAPTFVPPPSPAT